MDAKLFEEMQIGDRFRFGSRFWIVRLDKGFGVVDVRQGYQMTHISRLEMARLFPKDPERFHRRTAC